MLLILEKSLSYFFFRRKFIESYRIISSYMEISSTWLLLQLL